MIGQIKAIAELNSAEIRHMARAAFYAHQQITDCPFELGTAQADIWRKAFFALELESEGALV